MVRYCAKIPRIGVLEVLVQVVQSIEKVSELSAEQCENITVAELSNKFHKEVSLIVNISFKISKIT